VATANAALEAASKAMDQEIEKATGGLKIPGIT
jgi:DNA-binding protein YbaB